MTTYYSLYSSPVGEILLASDGSALTVLEFLKGEAPPSLSPLPLFDEASLQLDAYFKGALTDFTLPLHPKGTAFQQKVWAALRQIPYGCTASYKKIACDAGSPKAFRAVGGANHANPISIIIPCHRIIGADGSLTGYGGGLDRKAFLLDLERHFSSPK